MAAEPRPYLSLGRRVAEARKQRDLSQREAARLIGISDGYLPQIETGRNRPDPQVLRDIARVLAVDYDDLAALAGYRSTPDQGTIRVEPDQRSILQRLQQRFNADQLRRIEAAADAFFFELRREPREVADDEGDGETPDDTHQAGA